MKTYLFSKLMLIQFAVKSSCSDKYTLMVLYILKSIIFSNEHFFKIFNCKLNTFLV